VDIWPITAFQRGAGLSQARPMARSSREVPLRPRNAGSILLYEDERIPYMG
jgi:hypothetical protein